VFDLEGLEFVVELVVPRVEDEDLEGQGGGGAAEVTVHRGSPGPAFRHGALNRPYRPLDPGAPGADHTPLIAPWAAAPLWHVPAP